MKGLRRTRRHVPRYFHGSKVARGQGLHLLLHHVCRIVRARIFCWRWQHDSSGSMAKDVVILVIIAVAVVVQVFGSGKAVRLPALSSSSSWTSLPELVAASSRALPGQPDRKNQVSMRFASGSVTSVSPSFSQKRWPLKAASGLIK